jgi:hypothetical protein
MCGILYTPLKQLYLKNKQEASRVLNDLLSLLCFNSIITEQQIGIYDEK